MSDGKTAMSTRTELHRRAVQMASEKLQREKAWLVVVTSRDGELQVMEHVEPAIELEAGCWVGQDCQGIRDAHGYLQPDGMENVSAERIARALAISTVPLLLRLAHGIVGAQVHEPECAAELPDDPRDCDCVAALAVEALRAASGGR